MNSKLYLLNYLEKISGISTKELTNITKLLKESSLRKNSFLIKEGESPDTIHFVITGLLRSYYSNSDGKEFNKTFISEGNIAAAYCSLIDGTQSNVSIIAMEDTQILTINITTLENLSDQDMIWEKIRRTLIDTQFIQKEKRIIELLTLTPQERYKVFLEKYPDLESRISQYQIASYLGITPVALSRIKNRK